MEIVIQKGDKKKHDGGRKKIGSRQPPGKNRRGGKKNALSLPNQSGERKKLWFYPWRGGKTEGRGLLEILDVHLPEKNPSPFAWRGGGKEP